VGHAQRELERARRHMGLRDYLTVGEEVQVAARQHWVVLVKPAAIAVGVTALCIGIFLNAPVRVGSGMPLLLGSVITAAWGYLGWRMLVRHLDMFVATEKRILKYQRIVVTDLPMMVIGKITDLRFTRSVWGELLGYGTLVVESAGQDQAIREITYLPDPVENYLRLCAVIFGREHHPRRAKKRKQWQRQLRRLTTESTGRGRANAIVLDADGSPSRWVDVEVVGEPAWDELADLLGGAEDDRSRAIPVQGGRRGDDHRTDPLVTARREPEVLFESEDIKARRRAADTGPIRYFPTDGPA